MSIEAAINLVSSRPQPAEGLTSGGVTMSVRSGATAWIFYQPKSWLDALVRRVGAEAFARVVDAIPNLSGAAKAVARIEYVDGGTRLTKYGASQRGARELEKLRPRRRVAVDVSAAEKLPSTFGTKGTTQ